MEHLYRKAASFLDRAPDLWRENVQLVELNRRFLWFVLLRFGVAGALVAVGLTKEYLIPAIGITSFSLFLVAGILLLLNIFYWFYYEWAITYHEFPENAKLVAQNVQIQIILDFLILGYLVYECGGIESPLVYFFLFHNTLSCLFFRRRISILHTLLSIAIILTIFLLTAFGVIPERHFIDPALSGITVFPHRFAAYYLAGVVSLYLAAWYLISTITESLRAQERELQEKIQELIDLAHEKTRYLLVTTHELKAPFAAIQSYVNVALAGYAGELPEKIKDILLKIHARCEMLVQMLTDMIRLANTTSLKERRYELVTSRVDLSEVVASVLPRFRDVAAKKKVSFDTGDLPFTQHFIEADSEQIEILLGNIIGNAVSYSYPETKINIAVEEEEHLVRIRVSDEGIGIKKEHMEKVFLEHFRAERAVDMNPNSTGLGLTIARQIMDIHHGRIWIESELGQETTVFMEFPKSSS